LTWAEGVWNAVITARLARLLLLAAQRIGGDRDTRRTIENSSRYLSMRRFSASPKHWLRCFRRQIERLPPYPALLILAGPLAVVEPLKVATVFIAGEGHWITGGLIMVFAYAVSLFVTHWLFKIVKPKLLTLLWFARGWARFVTIRNKTLRWLVKSANLPLRSQ
jgi:hypothetical protein